HCGGIYRGKRSGAGGAKGGGQRECAPAKHALDSEPERIPEVGAVCGKAACTVLCGGRAMKRTSLPLQRFRIFFGCLLFSGALAMPARLRPQPIQPATDAA